jgi:hypothetical protein
MSDEGSDNLDFNKLVTSLVVQAIKQSPNVQDELYLEAMQTLSAAAAEKKLIERPEFTEVKDALIELEQDTDSIDDDLADVECRVDALEKECVYEEDFQALERDFMILQKKVNQFLPLLDALNKAAPLLKMLGLVKDQKPLVCHYYHPKNVSFEEKDEKPVANWVN